MRYVQVLVLILGVHFSLFSSGTPFSDEVAQLAETEGEPSCIVNGSVHVITGSFVDTEVDCVVAGSRPLYFERSYCSGAWDGPAMGFDHGSFRHNHLTLFSIVLKDKKKLHKLFLQQYSDLSRSTASFATVRDGKEFNFRNDWNTGYTNVGHGMPWGGTNLKNWKITRDSDLATFTTGSHAEQKFRKLATNQGDFFYLINQVLPSSHQMSFSYNFDSSQTDPHAQNRLGTVRLTNQDGSILFGSLTLKEPPKSEFPKKQTKEVVTSDGQTVKYRFDPFDNLSYSNKKDLLLTEVIKPHRPTIKYKYARPQNSGRALISEKLSPDGRFIKNTYTKTGKYKNGKEDVFIDFYTDPRLNRVLYQEAPAGLNNSCAVIYRYNYCPKLNKHKHRNEDGEFDYYTFTIEGGHTDVVDGNEHYVRYAYDKNFLLTSITKFKGTDKKAVYSTEKLGWDSNNNLTQRALYDENNECVFARRYIYDEMGNVLENKLTAIITGKNPKFVLSSDGESTNGADCYKINYTYSNDGFNLLLSQTDGKKTIRYTYKKGTDLVEKKFISEGEKIYLREFFEYDATCTLCKKIVDDGKSLDAKDLTGVTERHITYTENKKTTPVGYPIQIKEMVLDINTGQEKLIKLTKNEYNTLGQLTSQTVYGSDSQLMLTQSWEYDINGNMTSHTDALGQIHRKMYDANCNLVKEFSPRGDHWKEYTYDHCNRLIEVKEISTDGEVYVTKQSYDVMGQKIKSTDSFGQDTTFQYDEFGRVIKVALPKRDNRSIEVYKTYDTLGHVNGEKDALGHTTQKKNNIYGKPLQIYYPDGTKESFDYDLEGNLKKSVSKNGSYQLYNYDYQNRLIEQRTFSSKGALLSHIKNSYNAFHLLSTTDNAGHVTTVTYDAAGRKFSETKGNARKEYVYDTLGRVEKTIEWYGERPEDVKVTITRHDNLSRLIEERIEDFNGNSLKEVSYVYDADNNRTHQLEGSSIIQTIYDLFKRPILISDAMGNQTTIRYDNRYKNTMGQNVLQKTAIDPLGNLTITTYDVLSKETSIIRKSAFGDTLSKREFCYDLVNNLTKVVDTCIAQGYKERTITTFWEYDSHHRLKTLYEAYGTKDQKITRNRYNAMGEKEVVVKPNGVEIYHLYDDLGCLVHFYASDQSFNYSYEYDPNKLPIKVTDHANKTVSTKEYDENERLVKEVLGNGLELQYAYDRMGRPTLLTLPDSSQVSYVYDANYLKEVTRLTPSSSFTHTYRVYDKQGRLLEQTFACETGQLFEYDLNGREIRSRSDYFSENGILYDDAGNLISMTTNDKLGKSGIAFHTTLFTSSLKRKELFPIAIKMTPFITEKKKMAWFTTTTISTNC